MPDAQPLLLMRRDIDRKPHKIKAVLMDEAIRKNILGGIPNDPKKAIKAFASHNSESALKTKPKVRLLVPSRGTREKCNLRNGRATRLITRTLNYFDSAVLQWHEDWLTAKSLMPVSLR